MLLNRNGLEWTDCIAACLIGLRFFQHRILGMSPYTVTCGLAPRIPIAGLSEFGLDTFTYDE